MECTRLRDWNFVGFKIVGLPCVGEYKFFKLYEKWNYKIALFVSKGAMQFLSRLWHESSDLVNFVSQIQVFKFVTPL
jgi:hypothetical protein